MQIKKIKIANLTIENNLFLAPLAGYSDAPMRKICRDLGAGLTFTEMVSCKGLFYNNEATKDLLFTYDDESPKGVQLFGNDPLIMEKAVLSEEIQKFDIIDINMGCPVKKVYSNGEGSALLNDFDLASKMIKSAKKSGKPVSVKFRIGLVENEFITRDFAKMCEDSGADLITIHGRVRTAIYSGEPNYEQIALAKNAVKIPVIANGGIFSVSDADKMISETGADGIMLARGALQNPLLFSELLNRPAPTLKEVVLKHLELLEKAYGVERSAIIFRKQIAFYLKGVRSAKRAKEQIFKATNSLLIKNILNSLDF